MRREEKRELKILGVAIIFLLIALFALNYITNRYTRPCIVTGYNGNGIVTCQDMAGESWVFRGDGFYVGEEITLKMSTNGTFDYIYDDVILKVIK